MIIFKTIKNLIRFAVLPSLSCLNIWKLMHFWNLQIRVIFKIPFIVFLLSTAYSSLSIFDSGLECYCNRIRVSIVFEEKKVTSNKSLVVDHWGRGSGEKITQIPGYRVAKPWQLFSPDLNKQDSLWESQTSWRKTEKIWQRSCVEFRLAWRLPRKNLLSGVTIQDVLNFVWIYCYIFAAQDSSPVVNWCSRQRGGERSTAMTLSVFWRIQTLVVHVA